MEISLEVQAKTKSRSTLWPYYAEECKPTHKRDTCTSMFVTALFIIAKLWNQNKCPINKEQIKKMWYLYPVEYYSSIKKNEIMLFSEKWMELDILKLSKISQAQKSDSTCFCSYVESRSKMILLIIICTWT
jgi:hypothetical protein